MKVFSRAGHFEAEWFCMDKSDHYWSAHSSKWSVHNMPPPPSPLRQVIEIREFNSTFEVHLLFLLPRHICTAAEESKNKEGSAVAANDWRAIIVVGGGGKGGLLSGKNLAGQEAKQHESQNSPSVCGLLRNDQMRHQWDNTPSVSINTSCRAHTKRERERDWGRKREPCKPVAQSLFALKLEGDKKRILHAKLLMAIMCFCNKLGLSSAQNNTSKFHLHCLFSA